MDAKPIPLATIDGLKKQHFGKHTGLIQRLIATIEELDGNQATCEPDHDLETRVGAAETLVLYSDGFAAYFAPSHRRVRLVRLAEGETFDHPDWKPVAQGYPLFTRRPNLGTKELILHLLSDHIASDGRLELIIERIRDQQRRDSEERESRVDDQLSEADPGADDKAALVEPLCQDDESGGWVDPGEEEGRES